jgi:hypothetical protein
MSAGLATSTSIPRLFAALFAAASTSTRSTVPRGMIVMRAGSAIVSLEPP